MLRLSRRWLLTFESLACQGIFDPAQTSAPPHAIAASAAQEWARIASDAPLPLPVAAPLIVSSLRSGDVEEAAAKLVTHPHSSSVLEAVLTELCADASSETLPRLERLLELLRSSTPTAATAVLQAMARVAARVPSASTVEAAQRSPNVTSLSTAPMSPTARVRHAMVRQVRFEPSTAAALLQPLCAVSAPVTHDVDDVMDTLRIATKGGGVVHPSALAAVLLLVAAAGDVRHVASLWGWMQHTSVCWDVEAASAAMGAFCELGRLQDAVMCMQSLAEVGCDPSPVAQLALLQLLGHQRPPMPEYAQQLVTHWYPQPHLLWGSDDGAVEKVGLALLSLLHACHDADGLENALVDAYGVLKTQSPQRLFDSFLASPVVTAITLDYASSPPLNAAHCAETRRETKKQVTKEVADLLFWLPITQLSALCASHGLPSAPVLAGLAVMGHALGEDKAVLEAFSAIALDAAVFAQVSRTVAETPLGRGGASDEKLRWIESLARASGLVVPEEVRLWLELVAANQAL